MKAIDEIIRKIEEKSSFVLEAGAGSGKTFTLVETLNYLIQSKSESLKAAGQKIVCVTYTNVAKNEINSRIENNELVHVSTIHEFLWGVIKQFQKQLKAELCKLNEIYLAGDLTKGRTDSRYIKDLEARIDQVDNIVYNDNAFNDFETGLVEHDDVIILSKMMFENYLTLSAIVAARAPYILVDEYQDTAVDVVFCLIDCLLEQNSGKLVLGFYGDSHQKIYDYGTGDLERYYVSKGGKINLIKKHENYRSCIAVVDLLNKFRTNIRQIPQKKILGSATFIYWKDHPPKPKKGITAFEAENAPTKNALYDKFVKYLQKQGWEFSGKTPDKILVLANKRVALRAGFGDLYAVFSKRYGQGAKERLLDRGHFLISYFIGSIDKKTSQEKKIGLEHLLLAWKNNNHNEVIRFIRKNGFSLKAEFKHSDKKNISDALNELYTSRLGLTVGDVYQFADTKGLSNNKRFCEFIERVNSTDPLSTEEEERRTKDLDLLQSFMKLNYSQIISFWEHLQNSTVFSTKHSTKGDEFKNVLAVIDDTEWKQEYNFCNFFNNKEDNEKRKLNTRNLFYVECSRAMENLVILCLSELDAEALINVKIWFGDSNVRDIKTLI